MTIDSNLNIKYGIKCRRVVDTLMFDPNWYVPNESDPYCEDWKNNPLYDTYDEAEQVRQEYEKKDKTINYVIYELQV